MLVSAGALSFKFQPNARRLVTEKGASFAITSAVVKFTCSSNNHTARNGSFVISGEVKN